MKIVEKIGNLTIDATLTEDGNGEFVGDFCAYIPFDAVKLFSHHYSDRDVSEYLDIAEDNEPPIVQFSNADALIKLLRGLAELPENTLTLEYFGNPYWFFHDLQHVKNDCEILVDGTISLQVEDYREESALMHGAVRAHAAGVKLSLIARALIAAEHEFSTRWNYKPDITDRFLDNLE